jgi:hypothetical protein
VLSTALFARSFISRYQGLERTILYATAAYDYLRLIEESEHTEVLTLFGIYLFGLRYMPQQCLAEKSI